MKKLTCVLAVLSVLLPLDVYAQGKPAGKTIRTLMDVPDEYVTFVVGNARVRLPSQLMRLHGEDLMLSTVLAHLNNNGVSFRSSAKNDALILRNLQKFIANYQKFHANGPQIAAAIESRVFTKNIPYPTYLPKNLHTLYVGEIHDVPGIAREVEKLLVSLKELYPNRRIYLATEFLPAQEEKPFSLEEALTSPAAIQDRLNGFYRPTSRVLNAAVRAGIPVVGLEEEQAIFREVMKETQVLPTLQMYEEYAVSLVGMRFRNRAWAKRLRALRAADPDALIIVYAGAGHLGYNWDFNLPSLVGGKSFVLVYTAPSYLSMNNPLFRYFRESEENIARFHASAKAKLVENWKKQTPFNKILGADMMVIVKPQK